jgi:cation diffusion facilitator family transporter
MHSHDLSPWRHEHLFGADHVRAGERRTWLVVLLTAGMMVAEIAAGLLFGSMALLADGLHMASHGAALAIALFAYAYARRHAADRRYSFGTGKVDSLAGFASALLLAGFAALMAGESLQRFADPVPIAFDQALLVAVLGLAVNGLSAWLLTATPRDHGDRHHGHAHADHGHGHDHHAHAHHHDHNLRAAYLHVLADALTSLLAIVALLAGKHLGAGWLDPAMGLVGAVLVARWSWGLLRDTAGVLLDRQAPAAMAGPVRALLEQGGDRIADLHLWSIGRGRYAAAIALVSDRPMPPDHYRRLLTQRRELVHATIEVHHCRGHGPQPPPA